MNSLMISIAVWCGNPLGTGAEAINVNLCRKALYNCIKNFEYEKNQEECYIKTPVFGKKIVVDKSTSGK